MNRDQLGRMVRDAWVRWAGQQPDPKPSWLVGYDDLSEPDKEADRQIGEALYLAGCRAAIRALEQEELDLRRMLAQERDAQGGRP